MTCELTNILWTSSVVFATLFFPAASLKLSCVEYRIAAGKQEGRRREKGVNRLTG